MLMASSCINMLVHNCYTLIVMCVEFMHNQEGEERKLTVLPIFLLFLLFVMCEI